MLQASKDIIKQEQYAWAVCTSRVASDSNNHRTMVVGRYTAVTTEAVKHARPEGHGPPHESLAPLLLS